MQRARRVNNIALPKYRSHTPHTQRPDARHATAYACLHAITYSPAARRAAPERGGDLGGGGARSEVRRKTQTPSQTAPHTRCLSIRCLFLMLLIPLLIYRNRRSLQSDTAIKSNRVCRLERQIAIVSSIVQSQRFRNYNSYLIIQGGSEIIPSSNFYLFVQNFSNCRPLL